MGEHEGLNSRMGGVWGLGSKVRSNFPVKGLRAVRNPKPYEPKTLSPNPKS